MPIQTGEYHMCNVKEKNIAFLGDQNAYTPLTGMARCRDSRDDLGGMWRVTWLDNGKYTIQNVKHSSYASTKSGINLKPSDIFVEGKRPDDSQPQQFILQEVSGEGQYVIGTTDSRLFWCLTDSEPGTPISLSNNFSNSRCWWTFRSPAKMELYCTITNGNHILSFAGIDSGSMLELRDGGEQRAQRTWIVSQYSPSKYFIQDLETDYYAVPNFNRTMVILGSKKYVWNLKAHSTIPNRYWIYLNHAQGDLYWNAHFEEEAGITIVRLGQPDDTLCGFRIMNLNDSYTVDYSSESISLKEFIGHLNSVHPNVQAEALDHIASIITNPTMVTKELLEPLIRISFFSSGPYKISKSRRNMALKSIAPVLWSSIALPMPDELLMHVLLLIEHPAAENKETPAVAYEENSRENAHLIDCLLSSGVEIVRLACRILCTFTSFSKTEIEAIMRNMGQVLDHEDESDVERVVAALHLLKVLIKLVKQRGEEPAISWRVKRKLRKLEKSESAVLWIPVREVMEELKMEPVVEEENPSESESDADDSKG
ncbi:hypothetical protein AMATHDRAFT_68952 [Amanita thiersii Skay4041]|uniref:Uncharacterized protein n=1 Tax=Amanita thiersii Skay4041 TaxID=703135 RepID=A0A2A9NGS8_9AGAR|nr:hypothetical protein AMATHDRAFT_68952 [Amanita thiersii Skay4041]